MALKPLSSLRTMFKEPQLMHKWSIEVPTWPSAGSPANADAMFFVTTSSMPAETHDEAKIQLGGFELQYNAKTVRSGEIEWSFFDNTDRDILKYFFIDYPNKRQESTDISTVTLKSSTTADLICPVVNMNLYNAAGDTVTTTIQLMNCLFKPGNMGELGQDAIPLQPSVTVTYDWFIIK